MFVYSLKSKHIKIFLLVAFIAVTIICLSVLSKDTVETAKEIKSTTKAETNDSRIAFLSGFGWDVSEEPVEVREVIIPNEFDETYTKYNEIQKSQGFDLKSYAGSRAKRWTYKINNYQGYEGDDTIRANLLVLDGNIIGGDVCSVKLDGFMHGFQKP